MARSRRTPVPAPLDPLAAWRFPSELPLDRSLDELEEIRPDPKWAISDMIRRIMAARSKPLGQLEPGEIRLLLGQQDGVPWILPLALRLVEEDPLRCATFYDGDLLEQVLRNEEIWQANPEVIPALRAAIEQVVQLAVSQDPDRSRSALRVLELLEQRGLWPWTP